MIINITDSQIVGETLSTLFSMFQTGPVNAMVILKNSGVNTMNYDFQEFNGTAWVDLGAAGTVFNTTLQPNEVALIQVTSNFPQVQLVGNASGGAFLEFALTRYFNRANGGPIPILNL
jgi:hypothetical protein